MTPDDPSVRTEGVIEDIAINPSVATITVKDSEMDPEDMVMPVLPLPTEVTSPSLSTVTIDSFPDDQVASNGSIRLPLESLAIGTNLVVS